MLFTGLNTHSSKYLPEDLAYLGEPCLYHSHSTETGQARCWRNSVTHGCLECEQEIRDGNLGFALDRLAKSNHTHALAFWRKVSIESLDECWPWNGKKGQKRLHHFWRRPQLRNVWSFHPSLIAIWLTYGDVGRGGTISRCQNRGCCNPLHNIPISLGDAFDESQYSRDRLETELDSLKYLVNTKNAPKHLLSNLSDAEVLKIGPLEKINKSIMTDQADEYHAALSLTMSISLTKAYQSKVTEDISTDILSIQNTRQG